MIQKSRTRPTRWLLPFREGAASGALFGPIQACESSPQQLSADPRTDFCFRLVLRAERRAAAILRLQERRSPTADASRRTLSRLRMESGELLVCSAGCILSFDRADRIG
jgi:hypothetical protein